MAAFYIIGMPIALLLGFKFALYDKVSTQKMEVKQQHEGLLVSCFFVPSKVSTA